MNLTPPEDWQVRRTEALIGIAHPDFQAELLAAARQRCYVFPW